jgi:hypothetical protein
LGRAEFARRETCALDAIRTLADPLRALADAIRMRGSAIRMLCGAIRMLSGAIRMLSSAIRMLSGAIRMLSGAIRMLSSAIRMLSSAMRMLSGAIRELSDAVRALRESVRGPDDRANACAPLAALARTLPGAARDRASARAVDARVLRRARHDPARCDFSNSSCAGAAPRTRSGSSPFSPRCVDPRADFFRRGHARSRIRPRRPRVSAATSCDSPIK